MANTKSPSIDDKMGMSKKNKILSFFATAWFVMLSFVIVFPIFAGLLASFRPGQELIRKGLSIDLDFSTMTLNNYIYLFSGNVDSQKYFMWFKNSMVLTLISVVGTLAICYLVAYGLSMYEFPLRRILFFMVIATMMVPFEILMLPLYKEMITFKLIDTTAGVVLPGLCGASTIFFFRQYMIGLPKELLDAGRIDGATEYGICFKIMLPITKPAFAAMSILCAMGAWNNILWPMLVYRSANKFTLPIGLNTLLTPYGNNYDVLIAGSMFGIIPVFVVFLCFQSYFIDGMTAGAVKG
ncbi:carbohydrate ABC transporter permease [Kineothrix sp. MB12-C1]|uniref:carbohydrate ABC transporter permease n=1 Tax=Kineothrix sp. MB12-C1 TaxID=3070215 RepID=UPI0027D31049|nr:carbohydrate ABC transporter permease [Kineothrix sp. MB12-C1]WMC91521.1 carbohydrate ABC transporter permease [Kineothrix sp. MB12-C1]